MKLYLEKRGCDFFPDDARAAESDLDNYRYFTEFIDREGRRMVCELSRRDIREQYTKRSGKTDLRVVSTNGLYISTSYTNHKGTFGGPAELPFTPHYTRADVLRAVNHFSIVQYDSVEIVSTLPPEAHDYPPEAINAEKAFLHADHVELVSELEQKINDDFACWLHASPISFHGITPHEYKTLTYRAFQRCADRYGIVDEKPEKLTFAYTMAKTMAKHFFEEQDVIDPYADWEFIGRLRALCPLWIDLYTENNDPRMRAATYEPDEFAAVVAHLEAASKPTVNAEGVHLGDLFVNTWGWEQTNRNFYQVTELRGQHTIVLRELDVQSIDTGNMTSLVRPIRDRFKGDSKPVIRRTSKPAARSGELYINAPTGYGGCHSIKDGEVFTESSYA